MNTKARANLPQVQDPDSDPSQPHKQPAHPVSSLQPWLDHRFAHISSTSHTPINIYIQSRGAQSQDRGFNILYVIKSVDTGATEHGVHK